MHRQSWLARLFSKRKPEPVVHVSPDVHRPTPTKVDYLIYWLSAIAILSTVPTFGLLLYYSDHRTGKFEDDLFWSQLQGSIAQMMALLIASLTLWKRYKKERKQLRDWDSTQGRAESQRGTKPRRYRHRYWVWLAPTIVSFICATLAVPLYVVIPTDWSQFLAMISMAIQTHVIAQLALTGNN